MDKFNNLVREANTKFKTADHLIYVTYSLLKDQKLMLSIIQNLHSSALSAMAALLYYEKIYKRIDMFPLDVNSRIEIFENYIVSSYNLKKEVVKVMKELRLVIEGYKDSPLEFARKERLIICNEDYSRMNIIDLQKLKYYASNIGELIDVVNGLKNV